MNLIEKTGIALLLALGLTSSGCRKGEAKDQASDKKNDEAIRVETVTIARGPIESAIKHSTHLEAEEEVKIFARTANRVTELLVEEGDEVKKDQVLLKLNSDIQTTAFGKAEVKYQKAKEEFERQESLYGQKLISEQAFKDAQFELKQLALALEDARRELDFTEIRAPISGTITKRLVKYADLVNVNQHLFDIIDFNSLVARMYVPEKNLPELKLQQNARVTASSLKGQEFDGYVKRIAPIVESKSGTVKVTIGFKDVRQLRPGMYVDVELITAKKMDAILISKRALVYDGELSYVFRVLPDRKVERVQVEPRSSDKLNVEPAGGFQEGDQIVVAGQTGLKNGVKVRLPGETLAGDNQKKTDVKAEKAEPVKKS